MVQTALPCSLPSAYCTAHHPDSSTQQEHGLKPQRERERAGAPVLSFSFLLSLALSSLLFVFLFLDIWFLSVSFFLPLPLPHCLFHVRGVDSCNDSQVYKHFLTLTHVLSTFKSVHLAILQTHLGDSSVCFL